MRITIAGHAGSPDVDVEVPDDVRVADLRPHLAAATGRPELALGAAGTSGVVLAVDDVALDDDQLTGLPPLLPGATVRIGVGSPDLERVAVRSWHLAVVGGPDSGALVPADRPVVVGRAAGQVDGSGGGLAGERLTGGPGGGGTGGPGGGLDLGLTGRGAGELGGWRLDLDDPAVSGRHLLVRPNESAPRGRRAPGRRGRRWSLAVQDLGSRNGTVLVRGARTARSRPVGRRPRRLRPGDRLVLGATVLEVRLPACPTTPPAPTVPARPPSPAGTPSTWLAPAAGGVVFAAATGNPLMLALAAVGPVTALGAALVRRAAARRARRRASTSPAPANSAGPSGRGSGRRRWSGGADASHDPPRRPGLPDGVGLLHGSDLGRGAGLPHGDGLPDGAGLPSRAGLPHGAGLPSAANLRTDALLPPKARSGTGQRAAHGVGPTGDQTGGDPISGAPPSGHLAGLDPVDRLDAEHARPGGVRRLAPDGCLALVGPRPLALAVARLLVCDEIGDPSAGPERPAGPALEVWPRPGAEDAWSWCRWVAWASPGTERSWRLVVVDGVDGPVVPRPERPTGQAPGDGPGRAAAAARLRSTSRGPVTVLLVEADPARVPAWCGTVLHVARGSPTITLTRPGVDAVPLPLGGVSRAWAERQARLLAGTRHLAAGDPGHRGDGRPGTRALPRTVALADMPGIPPPRPDAVLHAWGLAPPTVVDPARTRAGGRRSLVARLGAGVGGPVLLDLVRDGPHGLVAGTTGAGKSELLQTWVLSLALTHSPAELAVLLVDYKGGAGLGACTGLPHVVGQLTDLDPALAVRALTGLRAELRRRERVLARWGAPDLPALVDRAPQAAPPRLLVVVDEFRALLDDLPGFVPALVRLAAQGRSLGVHLLLATQRPGGAVGPDLRANLAIRVALRVTDAADSLDVLDVPDAARIPPHLVGRGLLRRGPATPEPLQVAHADGRPAAFSAPVRRAETWSQSNAEELGVPRPASRDRDAGRPRDPRCAPAGEPDGMTTAWVAAAAAAARAAGLPAPDVPWLPALPPFVRLAELEGVTSSRQSSPDDAAAEELADAGRGVTASGHPLTSRSGPPADRMPEAPSGARVTRPPDPDRQDAVLPFALGDVPAEQRRALVGWHPWAGPLLVVGAAASGRTTALRTLGVAALDRGWSVHSVSAAALLDAPAHPGLGTCASVDDARLVARLVSLLGGAEGAVRDRAPRLLLVDGLDLVLERLGTVARGRGADRLVELVRDGRRHRVCVAASAPPTVPHTVAALFTDRLVLPVGDPTAETMAGVPADLAGGRRPPGRGVWLPATIAPPEGGPGATTGAVLCQVAVAGGPRAHRDEAHPVAAPVRLRPVPSVVSLEDLTATGPGGRGRLGGLQAPAVPVGLGGDDGRTVHLPLDRGALVAGPPGSGRSTALAVIALGLLDRGTDVLLVARDGPLRDLGERRASSRTCGLASREVEDALDALLWSGEASTRTVGVVVVDDLDVLEQTAPGAAARLTALVAGDTGHPAEPPGRAVDPAGRTSGPPRPVRVVASAQTAAVGVAFRGPLAALRAARRGLVLAAADVGSPEVFGVDLSWDTDTARWRDPGRGVVVDGRRTVPVQVARPRHGRWTP